MFLTIQQNFFEPHTAQYDGGALWRGNAIASGHTFFDFAVEAFSGIIG